MPRSTLELSLTDLQTEVCFDQGFGRTLSSASADAQAAVAAIINQGLRTFYGAYAWSFLRPVAAFDTVTSVDTYDLPDDFGMLLGAPTVHVSNSCYRPLADVTETKIRAQQAAAPSVTGFPTQWATKWKGMPGVAGQKQEALLWPLPDNVYSIKFAYRVLPDAPLTGAPYLYGGALHSEAILASCLAVGERRLDGNRTTHQMAYQAALAASMNLDAAAAPKNYGYMDDPGNGMNWREGESWTWPERRGATTYNGVQY